MVISLDAEVVLIQKNSYEPSALIQILSYGPSNFLLTQLQVLGLGLWNKAAGLEHGLLGQYNYSWLIILYKNCLFALELYILKVFPNKILLIKCYNVHLAMKVVSYTEFQFEFIVKMLNFGHLEQTVKIYLKEQFDQTLHFLPLSIWENV